MEYNASSPENYIRQLPEERRIIIAKLREVIKENLPEGYAETMGYGIEYIVPHELYPSGYHVKPEQPLPFISIASQKNHIALYHMGIYMQPELLSWFREEYPKHMKTKLDMGKSCIRFKPAGNIPYELISELSRKLTVTEYIQLYEREIAQMKKK
ncbi:MULTISPECIES: DUF1801 domain-containing protein [unclassified Paenibacillus]|uniref:DUF1801 domain-containing protein n=1 Tax=unclassified Paenibacillus TaxID=185978 RepID=UPI002406F843|nr:MULTISPECIES: DUF1801 domain-containing protein [unclassified Paenibacillus]MDF9842322.1 uncharacterized protein YdhG (YjbR/CyaY superfamily) [Paenibacillus sp. PastF-2]MDF9848801.1 uncharacterized protein YdhG (YjbR/CyaY superfamily) [Paenibacillus sp. PastM-2]MDF9855371.1 uncharacterized protein YdhG (YjbR/CyaY superfamily) [Paenibacillus sp. PastF-1]MDH6480753.1 uncharacterized protein YdhG (YjbR/CyaY superfamily) [Paenibacillus sp. PastH-2]MDH6508066.1 uncharacterized protein YdhG (YjbR